LKLRSSLREFGFVNPIIIDKDFNVIAGHGRLMAAKEEGINEVPCVFADFLTEAQKKAYILADNRMAMDAGWDEELLKIEMEELQNLGYDLGYTGFDEKEIADLFASDDDVEDDDFDVDAELETIRNKNARIVAKEEGAVENGDIANIDFEGFLDGVAFDGGKAEKYDLEIGSGSFIPGFEEQIVGMKVGEEKDITTTFPEEYGNQDLAGKETIFKIKLHEIKKKELPALDDEFAKDVSEFDTLAEYKNSLKEKLAKNKETQAKAERESKAIEALVKELEVEIDL
jgi:FKBP-type peptidyl-prolyl cis-trans isomerase (trigger factor)